MGLDSLIPGTDSATDVVSQKVFVNGVELNHEALLLQITVNKSFNKIASAKLTFADGSPSERDFPLSNDNNFKPGNEIEIQLGYHGEVETVFKGIIVKHAVKVRQQSSSLLMIEAKDNAIKLTAARKSIYHIAKTDSDVIDTLAGNLEKDIEATTFNHKQIVQFNATDWDFIVIRAEANGMLVLTDDGTLIVRKPDATTEPVLVATFGQNILEFEAEMDARRVKQSITSHAWDYTQQELENSETGDSTFAENGNFSSDELAGVLEAQVKLVHSGRLTQEQLQDWSDAHALRNHLSKTVGRVRIEGNAAVKPGTMITLEGVGDRFNGNVFVTGILHHFEEVWHTDIQFGWRDDWFYTKEDVMDKPSSGLLPGVNGLQIGIVTDIDDSEEGGQYRVKVHIPLITTGNEGIWARVVTLDAGSDRGIYFRPEANDEVVIGFLNDDPREAVILGCLHSKDSHKSPLPEEDGATQHGIVTREGIKLIFDDTNKRLTLRVPAGAGEKSLIINNDSNAFEMKDENQNSIKMDAQGITIQAGAGKNVVIRGTQVMIN
jgi:Rhs element Vgr protein